MLRAQFANLVPETFPGTAEICRLHQEGSHALGNPVYHDKREEPRGDVFCGLAEDLKGAATSVPFLSGLHVNSPQSLDSSFSEILRSLT